MAPPCREPTVVSWPAIRHAVVFLLGCAVVLDAISQVATSWPEVLIGAVMIGVLPLDRLVLALRADPIRGRGRRGIHPRNNADDE